MKKWFAFIVCFGMFTIAFSQSKFSLGFRGGVNLSNLSNFQNLETKTSFYLGAFGQWKVSELYTFQPELGYSSQGGNLDTEYVDDVHIHYLTIAVANKFFVKGTGLHFIIAPGIDLDYDDTLIGLVNNTEGNDITFIDLSVGLGLGYEFKNGLGFEARYKQGIIDVFSGNFHDFNSEELQYETQLNGVFQFGLFYKFKL